MLFDSVGNEYQVGAIVRMYHFTGARKRKHYMYKQVTEVSEEACRVAFCHLPIEQGKTPVTSFSCGCNELKETTVIVNCYYKDMRSLKRSKEFKD